MGNNIDFKQLADLFFKELLKVNSINEEGLQFSVLYRTVNTFFNGITKIEKIQFNTIFSRVSFAFHKYDVSSELQWELHEFRKEGRGVIFQNQTIKSNLYLLGFSALCKVISEICKADIPAELQAIIPKEKFYDKSPIEVKTTLAKARVVISEIRSKERLLICHDETQPGGKIKVRYDETAINEQFHSSINLLKHIWKEYTTLNLLDISTEESFDGCDFSQHIISDETAELHDYVYSHMVENTRSICSHKWKLIRNFRPSTNSSAKGDCASQHKSFAFERTAVPEDVQPCTRFPDLELYDLEADPHECRNLAQVVEHQGTLQTLKAKSEKRWDLERFDADVRQSQARRWVVYEALRNGDYFPWDYQPLQKASERYMRNHMDLNVLEESQRFPRGE